MIDMTKGKCDECKLVFEWKGKPLLRDAYCSYCGGGLQQTTWQLGSGENKEGWVWVRDKKPITSRIAHHHTFKKQVK